MLIKDYKVHLSCFDSFKNIKTNDSNFSMIFQEIIDNFPFKPPRVGQLEVISKIQSTIDEGYEFIMLKRRLKLESQPLQLH